MDSPSPNNANAAGRTRIVLHWLEASRSHRILWLFEELGVPYELKIYRRTKEGLAAPELKQVHPLGKSPVVTIESPGSSTPTILAESAAICEYFCDHYGKGSSLVPIRYRDGKDGQLCGETESWLRYRMLMHYAEGSLMPLMLLSLVVGKIKSSPVPFFIKPITNGVASKIDSAFLQTNIESHYDYLEDLLATSPDGGQFLCGKDITAADIMLSFPLEAGQIRTSATKDQYPKVWAYVDRLQEQAAYKRALQKIAELEDSKQAP